MIIIISQSLKDSGSHVLIDLLINLFLLLFFFSYVFVSLTF